MNRHTPFLLAFVWLTLPQPHTYAKPPKACHQVNLTGHIHGQDNKPLLRTDIWVSRGSFFVPFLKQKVTSTGAFSISFCAKGFVQITLYAPHHKFKRIPIVIKQPMTLRFRAYLQPRYTSQQWQQVSVIGEFNGFRANKGVKLTKRADGQYEAFIPWKKPRLIYQLAGLIKDRRGLYRGKTPGTDPTKFLTKGSLYIVYRSWVKTKGGKAHIVVSPQATPSTKGKARVIWKQTPTSFLAFWRAHQLYMTNEADFQRAFRKKRTRNGQPNYVKELHRSLKEAGFDVKKRFAAVEARWKAEKEPEAKKLYTLQLALSQYKGYFQRKKAWDTAFCRSWGPKEPLWRFFPYQHYMSGLLFRTKDSLYDCLAPISRYTKTLPDPIARMKLISSLMRRRYFDSRFSKKKRYEHYPPATSYLALLQEMYITLHKTNAPATSKRMISFYLKLARSMLNSRSKLRRGHPAPAFKVKALHRYKHTHDTRITEYNQSFLRGKWTLLHFWSLWCGGCMTAMPTLHTLYRTYAPKMPFQILSIALDESSNNIRTFWKKWPMPWNHGIAEDLFKSMVAKTFELTGIPRYTLINPKGHIVLDRALLKQVEAALKKHLRPPTTQPKKP
tara:strand:- start:5094 stop:6929 length:1836 start_codon:yes stop_codon:yes gene_type:complete